MKPKPNYKISSFAINMVFLFLSLIGLSLIPLLSVQLTPTIKDQTLHVSVTWPNVSAEVCEIQVTSRIEGALAKIKGLHEIRSSSSDGRANLSLTFDENVNLPITRLEVLSILRSIYPKLPQGVYRPVLSPMNSEQGSYILSYSVIGQGSSLAIEGYLNDYFVPALSNIKGVYNVMVNGGIPKEWILEYDPSLLKNSQVSEQDIVQSISDFKTHEEMGKGSEAVVMQQGAYSYIRLKGNHTGQLDIKQIPVKRINGKTIYLSELTKLSCKESEPQSYYRINGLNRVNLFVYPSKNVNTIELADQVKKEIEKLKTQMPHGYSLQLEEDTTVELKTELYKLILRALGTVLILLFFVFLVNRQWRYILVVFLCLLANMLLSCLFYYVLKIEIHLYTLASITVSLGIVIDTIMVMADHYRQKGNRYVFRALLAATFTTIGALLVVFLMKDNAIVNMWDFAAVQAVTLLVSLAVAWFLVPSIVDQLQWHIVAKKRISRKKAKKIIWFNKVYKNLIFFSIKKRWWFTACFVLLFGLPLFLLPEDFKEYEPDLLINQQPKKLTYLQQCYNATFGGPVYHSIREYTDPVLGGTLGWFVNYVKEPKYSQEDEKQITAIRMEAFMPPGATLNQMNTVFIALENYLSQYKEIDKFVSQISSAENASMQITFKKEYENEGFPKLLKQLLINKVNEFGSTDFTILGEGRAFSNVMNEFKNSSIELYGYNFEELIQEARKLSLLLQKYQRIRDVEVSTSSQYENRSNTEFFILPNAQQLVANGSSILELYENLRSLNTSGGNSFDAMIDHKLQTIHLRANVEDRISIWETTNQPINQQNRAFKLSDVATIGKEKYDRTIEKVNQEYRLFVNFDFIGDGELYNIIYSEVIDKTQKALPFGFRVQKKQYKYWDAKSSEQYWYVFLGCIIIFFICAILLESLKQALVILGLIPLSFVGLFVAFVCFDVNFDQGGYAAFLLLSGQVVISALFVINDYNYVIKTYNATPIIAYLKAFHNKLIPIALTIISTVLGFIPFLWGEKQESFWFSMGLGTSAGLLFSLVVLPVYLPLFLGIKSNDSLTIKMKTKAKT